ncbi:MAG: hypothetical protein AAB223_09600, partial [Pseudomonadota bacterium]
SEALSHYVDEYVTHRLELHTYRSELRTDVRWNSIDQLVQDAEGRRLIAAIEKIAGEVVISPELAASSKSVRENPLFGLYSNTGGFVRRSEGPSPSRRNFAITQRNKQASNQLNKGDAR